MSKKSTQSTVTGIFVPVTSQHWIEGAGFGSGGGGGLRGKPPSLVTALTTIIYSQIENNLKLENLGRYLIVLYNKARLNQQESTNVSESDLETSDEEEI